MYVDASLKGMGAICDGHIYAASRSLLHTLSYSITQLEMANILVALHSFWHMWKSNATNFHVDNKAVVMSFKNGRTKNLMLQALSRTIWPIATLHDIDMTFKHTAGNENHHADILSCVFFVVILVFCKNITIIYVWWPINGTWCIPNIFV